MPRHDLADGPSLDVEEADIICPPVPGGVDEEALEIISPSDMPHSPQPEPAIIEYPTIFQRCRLATTAWAEKWIFAVSHRVAPGYRRPIPFEHAFFDWLDRKIVFEPNAPEPTMIVRSETDEELQHPPDHAIQHAVAQRLVQTHHALRAWEDIPPYPRSRGYNDQPAYTDDYDDFLWLPRDPLSTLDLDDTVEMRLSLTTSTGGSGRIGDWPPEMDDGEDDGELVEHDMGHDDFGPSTSGNIGINMNMSPETGSTSGESDDRLIDHLELPAEMGSEALTTVDLVRRGTKRVGERFNSILRRPRANTHQTDQSGVISMHTLSLSSRQSHERLGDPSTTPLPVTDASIHRRPSILAAFKTPTAASLPADAVRPHPRRPTMEDSAHSDSDTLTAAQLSTPTRPRPLRSASSSRPHVFQDAINYRACGRAQRDSE